MNNVEKNETFMSDHFWKEYSKRQAKLDEKLTRIDSGQIKVNALTESISLYRELLQWVRENTEISEEIRARLLENNRHVFERLNHLLPEIQSKQSDDTGANTQATDVFEMPPKSSFQQ